MIRIIDKKDCCGCGACLQRCPKQCISFQIDKEGFSYPIIDNEICIDCKLCEKVCPELNINEESTPLHTYLAINNDELVRKNSSSGGVFSLLAERIINEGGVVFGARFDNNWKVIMDYTESIDKLSMFRGSKYVQADTCNTFNQCEKFLNDGRKVLYSGTPCQVSALLLFLKKKYLNLITVDLSCHGVPSPDVWNEYLKCEVKQNVDTKSPNFMDFIKDIKFRDKEEGWKKYRFLLNFNESVGKVLSYTHYENPYFQAFNLGLIMRPSCYQCIIKNSCRSRSDITLADSWGIEQLDPSMDDDRGTSLVLINSPKGDETIRSLDMNSVEVEYSKALTFNAGLKIGCVMHPKRTIFFAKYKKAIEYDVKLHLYKSLEEAKLVKFFRYLGSIYKRLIIFR